MFIEQTENAMRTHIKKLFALTGALTIALGTLYAQNKEYDDLYFTPNDRVKVKKVEAEDRVVLNSREVQQLAANPVENYSAKNVNPEFIARYQAPSEEYSSDSEYAAEGEYFNEDYNYNNTNTSNVSHNNADVAIRDRYGNAAYFDDVSDVYWSDPFYYEGSIFDPFYSPHRYGHNRYSYGYRPFRSGWSLSFGFGNAWGMRSGWHSGFSFGYGWGSGYYDPFYSSYYDPFYSPYYGSYYGYGYPYRNNVVVINNYESRNDRTIKRGPGTSRSGSLVDNNRSRGVSTNESTGRSSSTSRVATSREREYVNTSRTSRENLDAQSRYYRRSREAVTSQNNAVPTNSRTYDSRSRSSSNYSTDSRSSTRSRSSYTRPSNSNSNSNSSYNRSESNSRTYSTPSRSRSNSNYTPSRSSRSSSYSAPSRSSSSGSSISSGSSSRSSSGTRSSSSSRSRRGN